MKRMLLCSVMCLALMGVAPAQPRQGPILHEIPPGCQFRPEVPDATEGPVFDSRGFFMGYYRPLPTRAERPAPSTTPEATPQSQQSAEKSSPSPRYRRPVSNPPLTNVGNSTYTGTPGYSPTVPYTNTGMPNAAGTPGYSPTVPYTNTGMPNAAGTPGYSPTVPYTNTGMPNAAGTPGYSPTLPYVNTSVPVKKTADKTQKKKKKTP